VTKNPRPEPSSSGVSDRMSRQRSRDTGPETQLRRDLHRLGYRFRVHYPVPGLPRRSIDIAFTKRHVAVFIDGCFWHACPEHATWPQANSGWWRTKLERNRQRDEETQRALEAAGWTVVRIWEHAEPHDALHTVLEALPRRRASGEPSV
jgi:DNA mismatch endonuclease, patch repair protein